MRDKKASSYSMRDQMIKDGYDPSKAQKEKAQSSIHASKYTTEYFEQVKNYNSNLTTLNSLYSKVTPLNKILVRPFLIQPDITESGLIIPYKQTIPVPTKSGVGTTKDVESDFPYSPKAVVISVPEGNTTIKPGDVVFLSRKAIQMLVIGTGADAELRVENAFVHPDSGLYDLPKDLTSIHYGYVMVDYFQIEAKL